MKVKHRILSIVALMVFCVPSLTYAAWWKPSTWFKKSVPVPVVQQRLNNPGSQNAKTSSTSPASKTKIPITKKEPVATKPQVAQSVEIEKLKKEVEELKKNQTKIETKNEPQTKKMDSQSSQKEEIVDKTKFVQIINNTKAWIEHFNKGLAESSRFAVMVREDMTKYPDSLLIQQAGQDWLNNNLKLDFLMNKLVEIDTKIVNNVESYTESNSDLQSGEIIPLLEEHQYYFKEYEAGAAQMKSLTKPFFDLVINTINNENVRLDKELDTWNERVNQANQVLEQLKSNANSTSEKQTRLNAVNKKIAALNEKYAQDTKDNDKNSAGATTIFRDRRQTEIDRKYQMDYNALQAEFQQIQYSI